MPPKLLDVLVDPHTAAPLHLAHDTVEELIEEGQLVSDSGAAYLVAGVLVPTDARSPAEEQIAAYEDLVGP